MARLFASAPASEPKSITFSVSQNWTPPPGVLVIAIAVGIGGRGTDGGEYLVEGYTYGYSRQTTYRDGTPDEYEFGGGDFAYGSPPNDYCNTQRYSSGPVSSITTCYSYSDASYWESYEATLGPSSVAFGLIFPGSYGNVAPTPAQYSDISITANSTNYIQIAPSGFITITYTE